MDRALLRLQDYPGSNLKGAAEAAEGMGLRIEKELPQARGIGWLTARVAEYAEALLEGIDEVREQIGLQHPLPERFQRNRQPVDPHVAWGREAAELCRINDAIGPADEDEAATEARHLAIFALYDKIGRTRARTLAGVAAQLRITIECDQDNGSTPYSSKAALQHALASIEGMYRRAEARDEPEAADAAAATSEPVTA